MSYQHDFVLCNPITQFTNPFSFLFYLTLIDNICEKICSNISLDLRLRITNNSVEQRKSKRGYSKNT